MAAIVYSCADQQDVRIIPVWLKPQICLGVVLLRYFGKRRTKSRTFRISVLATHHKKAQTPEKRSLHLCGQISSSDYQDGCTQFWVTRSLIFGQANRNL